MTTKKINLATALNRALDKRSNAAVPVASRTRKSPAVSVTPLSPAADVSRFPLRGFGLPALGRGLSSAVYGVGYYTSFGIVFGAMAVLYLLPIDNVLGHGFRDGGRAGKDAFAKWRSPVSAGQSRTSTGVTGRQRGADAVPA